MRKVRFFNKKQFDKFNSSFSIDNDPFAKMNLPEPGAYPATLYVAEFFDEYLGPSFQHRYEYESLDMIEFLLWVEKHKAISLRAEENKPGEYLRVSYCDLIEYFEEWENAK